jgi:RNA polymerase sigma factor (sigma-70 family)
MGSQRLRHPARLAGASLLRLQSDERLAELAVDGHEAAFAAIVDRYRPQLLRYCAGIAGSGRAEDAVQQALINAHDALTRTTDVRHLRPWLYRIAHNASLNVLRSVRDDVPLDAAHAATIDAGPAATYERRERLRETLAAVAELPERQRAALVLRELEGRSHAEIASALGVTKGSARQHLMRARVAMRGAVTAVTPYPLIAKLAEALTTASPGGWVDAAAGAGAGATIAKLTAGIAATGALVGGAVGTDQALQRHHLKPSGGATVRDGSRTGPRVTPAVAAASVVRNAALPALPATTSVHPPKASSGGSARGVAGDRSGGDGTSHGKSTAPAGGGSTTDDHSSGDDGSSRKSSGRDGQSSGPGSDGATGDENDGGTSSGQDTSTSGTGSKSGSQRAGDGSSGSAGDSGSGSGSGDSGSGGDGSSTSGSSDGSSSGGDSSGKLESTDKSGAAADGVTTPTGETPSGDAGSLSTTLSDGSGSRGGSVEPTGD